MGYIMNFVADYKLEIIVIASIFFLIMLVSGFKIFEKAKIDGYKVLIPIYNLYLFVTIADLPIFVVPLLFIPIVNIFVFWLISVRIGERFGKGMIFRIGMCIFPFIFYLWIAFSSRCLYKAVEENGHIRIQDQNSTLYNQFPDVEEVIEEPQVIPVPLENDIDTGIIESMPRMLEKDNTSEQTTSQFVEDSSFQMQPKVNPLGIVENRNQDNLILDVDSESPWESRDYKTEAELTKKVVTIDPLNDDPLYNPDAFPVKASTLEQYKVCKNCKARLDLDAKICFLCGHKVEEDEE